MLCNVSSRKQISKIRQNGEKRVKETTKITVVLPVYNVKSYIDRCIASLQNQTLREIEFIFVDDGSVDDSMVAVEAWAGQDQRVRILRNECNRGAGYSRNRGIEAARGDYISFVDPDDYLSPDFYELLYAAAMADGGHDIAKCLRCKVDDGTGTVAPPEKRLNDRIRAAFRDGRPLYTAFTYEHTCALYHHRLFADTGVRYGTSRNSEDITFLLHCCYQTDDLVFEETAIYYYVQRRGSIVHGNPVKIANGQINAMIERIEFLSEKGIDDAALKYLLDRTNDIILRLQGAQRKGQVGGKDFDCIAARIIEVIGVVPGALKASCSRPKLQEVLLGSERNIKGGVLNEYYEK